MDIMDNELKLRLLLPLPSEVVSEKLMIPHYTGERWCDERQCMIPVFGSIEFEKEYVSGICIGWMKMELTKS